MHAKIDLIGTVYESSFSQLNCVLAHLFSTGTGVNVKFRNIKSGYLGNGSPVAIIDPHSQAILGVGVETFNAAETVGVVDSFEYLLAFHLHADTILQFVFEILEGKMDETVV